jgi:hypothetical protein
MTKEQIHTLATDGWWIPPKIQKQLVDFGHGLEIGVFLPNQTWLVGVFEFAIEVKKQVCITLRCNIEDLRTTWHGQYVPDDAKLFGFKMIGNGMLDNLGIHKVMSHGAVLVVQYDLEWRFNADQSNATWQRNDDYETQEDPAQQLQLQQKEYDLSVNNAMSTRYRMSRLSPPVYDTPGDVDTSTPVRKRKRGYPDADVDARQIESRQIENRQIERRQTGQIESRQIGQNENVGERQIQNDGVRQIENDPDSSTTQVYEPTMLDQSSTRSSSSQIVRPVPVTSMLGMSSWGSSTVPAIGATQRSPEISRPYGWGQPDRYVNPLDWSLQRGLPSNDSWAKKIQIAKSNMTWAKPGEPISNRAVKCSYPS